MFGMNNMSKKKWKKSKLAIILLCLTIICVICIGIIVISFINDYEVKNESNRIYNIIADTTADNEKFSKNSFEALKKRNSDLIAYLEFDSGIISQPVVQTNNNDYYLNHSFNKEYYASGTIFMEKNSHLKDTNIVIYGHNNSYDYDIMFSRLNDIARDQEYYEKNSTFTLYTKNDVRKYVICYAFYMTDEDYEDFFYQQPTFENGDDFVEYIAFPTSHNLIKSIHGEIEYGNRFVCLQTCKRYDQNTKLVVLARETSVKEY